jgi:transposase
MDTHPYATSLTDSEWALIRPLLPPESRTGRPRRHHLRTLLDAIFYAVRAGHAWRFLPQEWPPWKTVYHYFRAWRLDGTWKRIHTVLRAAVRVGVGRNAQPSAGIIDSQSAKTTEQGGPHSFDDSYDDSYDGGKKLNGRKRHVLVDTQGLILKVVVHPAGVHDRVGARQVLQGLPARAASSLPAVGAHLGRSRVRWRLARLDTGADRQRVGDRLPVVATHQALFPRHAGIVGR